MILKTYLSPGNVTFCPTNMFLYYLNSVCPPKKHEHSDFQNQAKASFPFPNCVVIWKKSVLTYQPSGKQEALCSSRERTRCVLLPYFYVVDREGASERRKVSSVRSFQLSADHRIRRTRYTDLSISEV